MSAKWCWSIPISIAVLSSYIPFLTAAEPIILDTDIGSAVDDAFALGLAAKAKTLELLAVTTCAESAEDRAWMVCRFLHHIGKSKIPVAFGREPQPKSPIDSQIQYRRHPAVVWNRTSKPVNESAVELILKTLMGSQRKVTIVCIGPLTNVARLLQQHPEAKSKIARLVIMGGSFSRGYQPHTGAELEWNFKSDPRAAREVFANDVPITLFPLDSTANLNLEADQLQQIFSTCSPLTYQLQAFYELADLTPKELFDVAALSSVANPDLQIKSVARPVEIDLQGMSRFQKGEDSTTSVLEIDRQGLLKWFVKTITENETTILPKTPSNRSDLISRGALPTRVHVIEDFETDIEKRWWLAGKPDTKELPAGSRRSCRAMLTQDFDGKMGDALTSYKGVVFNPVPGPPMSSQTRLSFRYKLSGTGTIRVQLFSLSRGFHRYLSISGLKQDCWEEATVDMTQMRRPDGSGGPLSADERIDDIQFYVDPRADLWIDDIVLYEAAPIDRDLTDWPTRFIFTGWFDTGKQGKEWPGRFAIQKHDPPKTWKKAVLTPEVGSDKQSLVIDLRGQRRLAKKVRLRFQYFAKGTTRLQVSLQNSKSNEQHQTHFTIADHAKWRSATVDFTIPSSTATADRIEFSGDGDMRLAIDDLLLYVP